MDEEDEYFEACRGIASGVATILSSSLDERQKLGLAILSLVGPDWGPKDVKDFMEYLSGPDIRRVK